MVQDSSMHSKRRHFMKSVGTISALGTTAIAGCMENVAEGDGVSMEIASLFIEDHAISQGAVEFQEVVEEESDGDFSVSLSFGGEYGEQSEISELVREGALEGSALGFDPFDQYASGYFFVQTPFVPNDYEHILAISESEAFQPARDALISEGNQRHVGDPFYRGVRQTYTTENWGPLEDVSDAQGLPARITPWETWQAVWTEIGVDAQSIALEEVYTAAETGVVDGFEGPYEQTRSESQHEVCSYVNKTNNLTSVGGFYVNEDFYQGLDESQQDLLNSAFDDASEHVSELARESEGELESFFEEQGLEIIDSDWESFHEAAEPAIEEMFQNQWEPDMDEIMGLA